jgi:XTP/dITP diphosphohydrolase
VVEETGSTFVENALLKARAVADAAGRLPGPDRPDFVVADDSGLCVEALGGAPGVYSSRYAGPEAGDADNNRRLLRELSSVPRGERQAEFVCVMACVGMVKTGPGEVLFHVEGRCPGEILFEPRGEGGFGYDPLFFYVPLGRSFAELTADQKNAVSHRGRALALLRRKLAGHLEATGRL